MPGKARLKWKRAKSARRDFKGFDEAQFEQTPRPVLLIVDDEPLGLKSMASVFEGQGYELVLASSGAEAMQLVESGRPDVILLDVMMPGMNGLEACRQIRSHPGMAKIPILLVTALDDRQSRLDGFESGADDYITKPIDRAEVPRPAADDHPPESVPAIAGRDCLLAADDGRSP